MEDSSRTPDEHHNATYEYDGGSGLAPAADVYPQQESHTQHPSDNAERHVHEGIPSGYTQQSYQQPYMQQQPTHHHAQQYQQQIAMYPAQQQSRPYVMQPQTFRPRYMPFVPGQHVAGMPGHVFPVAPPEAMPPHYGPPPPFMHMPPVQHLANMSLGRPQQQQMAHHNARPAQHYGRPVPVFVPSQDQAHGSISPASATSFVRAAGTPVGAGTLPAKPAFVSPSVAQGDGRFAPAEITTESDANAGIDGEVLNDTSASSHASKRKTTPQAAPTASTSVSLLARLPAMPARPVSGKLTAAELETAYEEREDALLLRIEAIGFEPEASWKVVKEVVDGDRGEDVKKDAEGKREPPASALGIRLLQRLEALERENDELGRLLQDATKAGHRDGAALENELKDAQQLIDGLDAALTACKARADTAEAKVRAQEQALAVACAQSSTGITPAAAVAKAAAGTARPAAISQQQQQHKGSRSGKNAWKAAPSGDGHGAGK